MLELNWGFAFTIVNLLVLYVLLRKFLFGPVTNIMAERERLIRQQLDSAEHKELEAKQLVEQRETELIEVAAEADALIDRARGRAQDESTTILQDAGTEATRLVNEARKQIERERDKAMREISAEIAGLAVSAAAKAVGSQDSGIFDRAIIDAFLKEEGVCDDDSSR